VDAFLARPRGSGSRPGLVVIHEIMGLTEHIKDVANRFASQGYVALAPDLFSRQDLKPILSEENIAAAMGFMRALPTHRMRDRQFAQEELAKLPSEDRRMAIGRTMGLLFGGLPRESLVQDLVRAVDKLVKATTEHKKDFEMKIYPGAPHAYFNDTSERTYRDAAAREAWDRALRFYSRAFA
jgi:carboxymethylenebutenolidase